MDLRISAKQLALQNKNLAQICMHHQDAIMQKYIKPIIAAITLFALPQPAISQQVGVASAADPLATEAGMEMLRKGGSASDAAMAMMVALTVVEPQSSGIGGGGFLLYQSGEGQKGLTTINGRETAPAAATPTRFTDANGKAESYVTAFQGGKSVGVPGNIRLMAMAHKKWGKLRWSTLFQPAIRLAENGYVVNDTLELRLKQLGPLWDKFPETRALYSIDGKLAVKGQTLRNPQLAKTLRQIAKHGPDAFYKGDIAKAMVDKVTKSSVGPGDMTLADLASYKAKQQAAVCAPYRVYVVCGMGPPSSGATTVLQILGTLERFDMKAMGKDNPQSWHLIYEAMRFAYADREKYLGDPDFVNVPVAGLIDRKYLAGRSALISPDRSAGNYVAGNPPGAMPRTAALSGEVAGTSHFVAVDKRGHIASMTSTIEGPFGSQLITGGFFLNNELTDFTFAPEKDGAPVANRVQPGKRPLSSMSPTIVFDANGKPILALGSAGGKRIIMHVTKTLIGVLDFDMTLPNAIAMPNIFFDNSSMLIEQDTPVAAMAEKIAAFGNVVKPYDLLSKVNGAQLTAKGWIGAADPRSEGAAFNE
jgi:gamma-glutamyltranspeptidase / glutathione hydrolase